MKKFILLAALAIFAMVDLNAQYVGEPLKIREGIQCPSVQNVAQLIGSIVWYKWQKAGEEELEYSGLDQLYDDHEQDGEIETAFFVFGKGVSVNADGIATPTDDRAVWLDVGADSSCGARMYFKDKVMFTHFCEEANGLYGLLQDANGNKYLSNKRKGPGIHKVDINVALENAAQDECIMMFQPATEPTSEGIWVIDMPLDF